MILSDKSIRFLLKAGDIRISPEPRDWQMQPASVELTLDSEFRDPYTNEVVHYAGQHSILPGQCLLATTVERVEVPCTIVGRVEGKSSWGRCFLMVHSTAGFIDPGFKGQITLELKNLSERSLSLPVGSAIAQISFEWLDMRAERPYGSEGLNSHYQNQKGATPSAIPWN